jgi:hypothetical protein
VTFGGAFVVNGITYDTTNMIVMIDDVPGTIANVATGDVVLVTGTVDSTVASTGVAQKAALEHAVVGPIDSIDTDSGILVALGQTVRLSDATFDAASVPGGSLSGLVVGEVVAVSGFRNQRSDVIASRIAKKAPASGELRATGRVANLDTTLGHFEINALTVDYSSAVVTAGPSGNLAAGDVVEVTGASVGSAGELLAERVTFKPTNVIANTGAYVNLEGYITAIHFTDAQSFEVAGLPITTTADTQTKGALAFDTRTEVKGALASSGTLVASDVETGLAVPAGTHTLRGTVFDAYQGPLANATIFVWVESLTHDPSFSWSQGDQPKTDSAGRFEVQGMPDARDARLYVSAYRPGFFQPCAVTVQMTGDVTRDIEVVSAATLNSLAAPPPLTAHEPTLTGTVYETTAAGRQPVAGAWVGVDESMDLIIASTQTDLSGHYFLCDWPAAPYLNFQAYKAGYTVSYFGPPVPPQSTTHDFELEKQ